jgi:hypothetical protein
MEYAQTTTGATMLHAMEPAGDRTKAPSIATATSATTTTGSAGDRVIFWPRQVGLTSTLVALEDRARRTRNSTTRSRSSWGRCSAAALCGVGDLDTRGGRR